MEPCISVIVPIYKVEPYLRKCVDSILNQTYRNLEVILVDDGSPDKCGEICDEYAQKDSRVKVIHKENGGVSDARNVGLDVCTGEYITFVDSDDWIEQEHIHSMYSAVQGLKKNVIAFSDIRRIGKDDSFIASFIYQKKQNVAAESGFGYVWNKLYPAELLEGERFQNIPYIEDLPFNLRLLSKNPSYRFTKKSTYQYLLREESLLTADISKKKIDNFLVFTQALWSVLNDVCSNNDCISLYNQYAGNQMCNLLCDVAASKNLNFKNRKEYAEMLIYGASKGRMKWKYASHSLLKLAVVAEWIRCPWIYTEAYRILICRR